MFCQPKVSFCCISCCDIHRWVYVLFDLWISAGSFVMSTYLNAAMWLAYKIFALTRSWAGVPNEMQSIILQHLKPFQPSSIFLVRIANGDINRSSSGAEAKPCNATRQTSPGNSLYRGKLCIGSCAYCCNLALGHGRSTLAMQQLLFPSLLYQRGVEEMIDAESFLYAKTLDASRGSPFI